MTDELASLSAPIPKPMIDDDRLDELDTFRVDEDVPDDARVSLPARDVRDLVRLIPCLRAAVSLRDAVTLQPGMHPGVWEAVRRFDEERVAEPFRSG